MASLNLSLINQMPGQEVGQRGAVLAPGQTHRQGQSGTRTQVLCLPGQGSLPGCRPLGRLRFFLSQTNFFQLFLPHGLRVEEACMYYVQPSGCPSNPL